MGSKLTVLAALIALGGVAYADKAGEALKKGVALYKAGKYAEAVTHLQKAYDLAPKPELLFTLAQAQRQAGDCAGASVNYHKVIEQIGDLNTAKLVQGALALCEKPEAETDRPAKPVDKLEAPEPEPKIITKTVTREVPGKTDRVAASLFAGGTLAVGAAVGLYIAAGNAVDAANNAHTLAEHDSFKSTASTEQTAAAVVGIVGAGAIAYAIVRWVRGTTEPETGIVAIAPAPGGGTVGWATRW